MPNQASDVPLRISAFRQLIITGFPIINVNVTGCLHSTFPSPDNGFEFETGRGLPHAQNITNNASNRK